MNQKAKESVLNFRLILLDAKKREIIRIKFKRAAKKFWCERNYKAEFPKLLKQFLNNAKYLFRRLLSIKISFSILRLIISLRELPNQPSFSFTNVKIPVATLTTINVAIARQTASDSVNCQIAKIHKTVQATSEIVITVKEIVLTSFGSTTPRSSRLIFAAGSVFSFSICFKANITRDFFSNFIFFLQNEGTIFASLEKIQNSVSV